MYAFLLQWIVTIAEKKSTSKSDTTAKPTQNKSKRSKDINDDVEEQEAWDWSSHKIKSLELISRAVSLRLNKICPSSHSRDVSVNLFTRPAYQILENPENLKTGPLKLQAYSIISRCVKDYDHSYAAQTTVLQNLQYYEHLSEPMAELLNTLVEDFDYPQLAETILREISNRDFTISDRTGPKSTARFLVRLSELTPKLFLKQMGLLIRQLDSESYVIRCALIKIIGSTILNLSTLEQNEVQHKQVEHYFDVLEERFKDVNSICRCKILQVCISLCEGKAKFPKRRARLVDLVIGRLKDKSSNVRKNAIKALTKLLETHPFYLDGGELELESFQEKFESVTEMLNAIIPEAMNTQSKKEDQDDELGLDSSIVSEDNVQEKRSRKRSDNQASSSDDSEASEPEEDKEKIQELINPILDQATTVQMIQLQLKQRYYADALLFINRIHEAMPTLCQLLGSTNKAEVMETIDFFVTAHRYKITLAQEGIKKMLHLVWVKDTGSDEGKGIRVRLIEAFRTLYLTPDSSKSLKENINSFSRSLIGLTSAATLAELPSLEEILRIMVCEEQISEELIYKLWSVYGVTRKEIPSVQRRGAIIILGMLGKAKREIISERIDLLLKIGLGDYGKSDLSLAKYTCLALQSLSETRKNKGAALTSHLRLPLAHPIFSKLEEFILEYSPSSEWFTLAEQAINTIYLLCDHPDTLCGTLIKDKARAAFNAEPSKQQAVNTSEETDIKSHSRSILLSQLIFIVGHVAIKQIVHIEIIENEWKRRNTETRDSKKLDDDELDQVVGTTEDDVADVATYVRERELLFGPKSLLTTFGALVVHICSNNTVYPDPTLQIYAAMTLSKFMCVSSEYCEQHLQLLFTMLEKANDPVIRTNIVIALGDIAVCFNTLVGENIAYLYKRLRDPDTSVKINTLMVLAHLILNGMVKVKGQLGEMAKCLENPDIRISNLARLFFTELSSKDNAVYNNLPDIISSLSNGESAVSSDIFKRIMRFLFEFVKDKERQTENIVEKLCLRFRNTDDPRQWQDIGYCLSILPYKSDKTFKKLADAMQFYHDKLHDDTLFQYMLEIISKAKSQPWQRDKSIIDEFESKLREIRNFDPEDDVEIPCDEIDNNTDDGADNDDPISLGQ
ncbi:condensin complex non-SMC subunit Cnd1, variant 2 [Basidiobolus ranarum]